LYYEDYKFDEQYVTKTITSPACLRGYLLDEFKNEIVGLWSIVSIGESFYKKIVDGVFDETIFKNDIASFPLFKGEVYLTIGTLILHQDYRTMGNFKLLIATLLGSLVEFIKAGCVINSIVAFGYTDIGKKLCDGFGLNAKIMDKNLGVVFQKINTVPELAKPLFELIKQKRLEKIKTELESFGEESGLSVIKDVLKKWGYKVDGI
jgi:hypothetical protein